MRTAWIALLSSALLGLTCSPAAAQPASKPNQSPGAAQIDAAKAAQLRTQIHQTMSALSEAQNARRPDQAKLKQLNDKLAALRAELWAGAPRGQQQAAGCPWGGGGKGPCGMGMGMGRGPGGGQGMGMGMGFGPGPKAGPNAGMGQGQGQGRGRGPGGGQGMGMGQGRGQGGACAGCPGCLGCPNCAAGQGCQGQCWNCPFGGGQNQAPPAPAQGAGRRGQGRGQGGPR
jgi:hypothetical protein